MYVYSSTVMKYSFDILYLGISMLDFFALLLHYILGANIDSFHSFPRYQVMFPQHWLQVLVLLKRKHFVVIIKEDISHLKICSYKVKFQLRQNIFIGTFRGCLGGCRHVMLHDNKRRMFPKQHSVYFLSSYYRLLRRQPVFF